MVQDVLLNSLFAALQAVTMFALSPLIIGIIRKVKAWFQSRKGSSIWQPYYDLAKLLRKDSTMSKDASWISRATPYIAIASVGVVALMVPFFTTYSLGFVGDLIVVVYLLALFRFFMVLAGMDAGSTFGGMGSSREMMVSSIVEPTMLLAIFTMALITGTTTLSSISYSLAVTGPDLVRPALFLALAAFFISLLAENARVPVDNPATHLELTMIHEGMLLEYSGKQLALMEWASWTKFLLFSAILANVFFPWGIATDLSALGMAVGVIAIIAKVLVIALAVALIESGTSKMRLFRLPNLLTESFTLALLAVMSFYIL
ncbi:MAG: NADH:ubiquinone oxidoreductase subunit H [Methanomassiliicoccales archaeon PtaU1.Bin124]|nr:MAG: NADH:ubiquinone oxidoreductase subunit H [Methanomassiliicoccales archaeon PtaU1.Bin124]